MKTLTDGEQIELELYPDEAEHSELRGGGDQLIADEDIGRSRVLIRQLAAERLPKSAGKGGVVAFDVTFHADRGNRFESARLVLSITSPKDAVFIDCQPRETVTNDVEISIDENGKMQLGVPKVFSGEAGVARKVNFALRHRVLRGSGAGTSNVIWDFAEDPERKDGILHQVNLAVTLPIGGTVDCSLSIIARLAQPGLDGRLKRFRRMIFGDHKYAFSIELPSQPPDQSKFWFGWDKLING
ncbi:hypothetical protein [Marinibacterium sp. SX1]|uniref:hypothetical protein n=1 Tax=Marinibacterium sp. SX1 TaxID=3388424 RepID=UPI003D16900E